MNENNVEIFEMAGGDVSIWIGEGGGICMKLNTKLFDPIELEEKAVLELANLLLRLVSEQRE